jgi:L-alanine-DL-glutamate epimerase-like enolase superfamily enzyme
MALWDALARVHGTPLVRLLGGREKPVRAYGAVGYDGARQCASVVEDWAKRGFTGIKAKIGYPMVQEDIVVVRALREATGQSMAIMVDYNQSLHRHPVGGSSCHDASSHAAAHEANAWSSITGVILNAFSKAASHPSP